MKNTFIILTLLFGLLISCNAQKNEYTNKMEKYNFEAVKNAKRFPVGIVRNDTIILIESMSESGAWYNEYPPLPTYYWIQKEFYPNGNLKSVIKIIGRDLLIGESIYYDEKGNVTKKVNEDAKFGKIKVEDLLRFLDKEGHINLETGAGFETAVIHETGQGLKRDAAFDIYDGMIDGKECWTIQIYWHPSNGNTETIYHLDKDTGEVLHKESKKIAPIM